MEILEYLGEIHGGDHGGHGDDKEFEYVMGIIQKVLMRLGEEFPDPGQASVQDVAEFIMNNLQQEGLPGEIL